jgi:hypothetical protein
VSAPRFTVITVPGGGSRLLDRGKELLTGPEPELLIFARWLSADPPADLDRLRDRLQACIMVTRGCSFATGSGLKGERA